MENHYVSKAVSLSLAVLFSVLLTYAHAVTRNVPSGPYPTIQSAITASSSSDEVVVAPGTYAENINFGGKNIIVRSTNPTSATVRAATIIDGNNFSSVVTFAGTESASCALKGFTITKGYALMGGGIRGNGTLATLEYNDITTNVAHGTDPDGYGGGIWHCDGAIRYNTIRGNQTGTGCDGGGLQNCGGTIEYNTIRSNIADQDGGSMAACQGTIQYNTITSNTAGRLGGGLYTCDSVVRNNTIANNRTTGEGGGALARCQGTIERNTISGNSAATLDGGGLFECRGTIQNNMIFDNWAYRHGGGMAGCDSTAVNRNNTIYGNIANVNGGGLYNSAGTVKNCIIWHNAASAGPQLYNSGTPTYCCIEGWTGGGTGNITADPQLVDPAHGNFHLQPTAPAPCIDAGGVVVGMTQDFDGDTRPYNAVAATRGDGSDYDIGADEYIGTVTGVEDWREY